MMEIIFLGTGGAQPTLERNTTCMCLIKEGEILMFDAGENAQDFFPQIRSWLE